METEFFKTDDGIYHKIERDYDSAPLNPRKDFDNLGKMVFMEQTKYKLGDKQVSDWGDFLISELTHGEGDELKFKGKITINVPTLEEAKNHRVLNKLYVVGNDKIGFRVDKETFIQDLEARLNEIIDVYREKELLDDLTCEIPLDNGKLSDKIEINYDSKYVNEHTSATDFNFSEVEKHIKEIINIFDVEYQQEELKTEYKLGNLTESELFKRWEKEQFYVLPMNIYEHSDIEIHPASFTTRSEKYLDGSNIEEITNSGFIYVQKDNKEVQEYLKEHSEEETKQWLENVFKGEIKLYSQYVNGEVYTITDSIFNTKTLNWDKEQEVFSYYGSEIEYIKETLGSGKYISLNEIQDLENTITPEFIQATGEKFIAEIQKCLSDFDGNVLYAERSVFNAWNRESKTELFPNKNKIKALGQFIKENGCDSPEKTVVFLEKRIKPSQQKAFDPFSYEAEKTGYETWLNPNSNKLASNYNSRVSPNHALIIDYQNKRFGILTGADSFSGDRLPNYKKNPLLSGKKFKEKIEKLLSEGFVFEKFTGESAEYAQGKLESFFPNKKKINSKENDYERGR